MPPAFNLSQDQTLQFNSNFNTSTTLVAYRLALHSEHCLLSLRDRSLAPPSTRAHTYRLYLFKERWTYRLSRKVEHFNSLSEIPSNTNRLAIILNHVYHFKTRFKNDNDTMNLEKYSENFLL